MPSYVTYHGKDAMKTLSALPMPSVTGFVGRHCLVQTLVWPGGELVGAAGEFV